MLLILLLLLANISCNEMAVTEEYTEYLKKHATWEVVDYEDNIFLGWTLDEVKDILLKDIPEFDESLPIVEADRGSPSSIDWGANCIHEVRNQGQSGSGTAYAVAGMLSDRCCIKTGRDHGWLSIQELISCASGKELRYIANGLVSESCFPIQPRRVPCPSKCMDGKDWKAAHVCACVTQKQCAGVDSMKTCLKTGPMTAAFGVSQSFMFYKSGIYKCESKIIGYHISTITGHSDTPECHWIIRNSWGTGWGMRGYVHMACTACSIDGKLPNGNIICEKIT